MIDHTHDPSLRSWVDSANHPDTEFPVQNLPLATFLPGHGHRTRVGVAIGDQVLDATAAFQVESMLAVMRITSAERTDLRRRISAFLTTYSPDAEQFLIPISQVKLLL